MPQWDWHHVLQPDRRAFECLYAMQTVTGGLTGNTCTMLGLCVEVQICNHKLVSIAIWRL